MIHDAGHAWLRVRAWHLARLGIAHQVSRYSYEDRQGYAYLEEDCDAPRFLAAAEAAGEPITITDRDDGATSRVRNLDAYEPPSLEQRLAAALEAQPLAQKIETQTAFPF
jgi:hypothetical protein